MADSCFLYCDLETDKTKDPKRLSTLYFYDPNGNRSTNDSTSRMKRIGIQSFWGTDWERQNKNLMIGQFLYRCVNLNNVTGFDSSTGKLTMSTFNGRCIQYVGYGAFQNKTQIKSVDMSPVLYVDSYAFKNCSNLQYIYNPNAIQDIGIDAFDGTKWYRNNGNIYITLGQVLYKFKGSGNCDLRGYSSITSISENAFNGSALTSIDLGNVNTFGRNAFSNISGSGLSSIKKYGNELDVYSPTFFTDHLAAFINTKYAVNRSEAKAKQIYSQLGLQWRPSAPTLSYKLNAIKKLYLYASQNWDYMFTPGNQEVEGALLTNKGVCASFALAYAYLLKNCGVNAQVVHGKAHAWNMVEYAPGQWAHIDITTAVCGRYNNFDLVNFHRRFLITDDQACITAGDPTYYWEPSDTKNMRVYNIYSATTRRTYKYGFGDINNDGNVNTSDLTRLDNYIKGTVSLTAVQKYHADLNLDGTVNRTDYNILKNKLN